MCSVLEVSRSGYYDWVKARKTESPRQRENRELVERIREIHKQSRRNYGAPRIHAALRAEGWTCGLNRIARLMRENGIRSRMGRKFRPHTTDSNHSQPVFENRLPEATIDGVDQVWAADITYIPTDEGWVYLATVMDLFSRLIVGWSVQRTLKAELPLAALQSALDRRGRAPVLHHSDRGTQYASKLYRSVLEARGIQGSMSRKGNCYDNATKESFYHSLKTELVHHEHYRTLDEARPSLFEYIEAFYNRERLHSSLGYRSPAQFEDEVAAA